MPTSQNTPTNGTPLASLGEFGLIDRLTNDIALTDPTSTRGVGDDCAVISPRPNEQTLVTTDILLEGVHFDLTYFPLAHLGYKAVVVNLSDVCAMNATPRQIVMALGIPKRFTVEMLEEFYRGVLAACQHYHVDLVGGDTSTSMTGFTISVTAIGSALPERITPRNGAKPNELLCVTGDLGAAYLGLQLLEREKQVALAQPEAKPDFGGYVYPLQRMLRPEARWDAVQALAKANICPSSMIDISDGLSSEVLHICTASHVGCRLYPERLPIDQQAYKLAHELNISPYVAAMNGGEDYELLFSVPRELQEQVEDLGATTIGFTTDSPNDCLYVTPQGQEHAIIAQGWRAF